jgi:hypothetical protein
MMYTVETLAKPSRDKKSLSTVATLAKPESPIVVSQWLGRSCCSVYHRLISRDGMAGGCYSVPTTVVHRRLMSREGLAGVTTVQCTVPAVHCRLVSRDGCNSLVYRISASSIGVSRWLDGSNNT